MESILQIDYALFDWINQGLQHAFLDQVMPWWRDRNTWIPLYAVLILFSIIKYKLKGLYFILVLALTVGVADTMSSRVIKKTVKRLRPCKTPALQDTTHLLVRCGSGYSFTSSHATNHFALAVFLFLTFCRRFKFLRLPLLFWATTIALGQVYVGVHFPLDILCGAILGSLIAYGSARLYEARTNWRVAAFYESKQTMERA